jgi:hypothetical protein
VFAARGYDHLRGRLGSRGRAALLAGVTMASLALAWSAPIPLVGYPSAADLPAAHRWLADQPGRFAILELPMPASEAYESERDARRQVWSLFHGKARADGVSGFASASHEAFRSLMQRFPEDDAVRAIVERGVRYVVVRYAEYEPADAARIRGGIAAARELALVFESGDDVVYSLEQSGLLGVSAQRAGEPEPGRSSAK